MGGQTCNCPDVHIDIGRVWDPKCFYHLDLTNTVPIWANLLRLHPEEEAWLNIQLDKLVDKGVIGPILLGEQPWCFMPLLLIPGIQSVQHYWVYQNIILVNKWMAKYQYQLKNIRQYKA